MRLVQIAGYLGSGKTTLVLATAQRLSEEGRKVAILVNDVGSVPVDGRVMEEKGLTVKDLGGGCICCQLAGNLRKTLEMLVRQRDPDILIIEPTGMAVPNTVRETALLDAEKTGVVPGPTIVLFDTSRTDKFLTYETLQRLIHTQLRDADFIALSKVDAVPLEEIERAREAVRRINPLAQIVDLSNVTGEGFDTIIEAVQSVEIAI